MPVKSASKSKYQEAFLTSNYGLLQPPGRPYLNNHNNTTGNKTTSLDHSRVGFKKYPMLHTNQFVRCLITNRSKWDHAERLNILAQTEKQNKRKSPRDPPEQQALPPTPARNNQRPPSPMHHQPLPWRPQPRSTDNEQDYIYIPVVDGDLAMLTSWFCSIASRSLSVIG